MTQTPGYNRRLTIKLTTTKNGQPRATYWSSGLRWLPIKRADAEMFLAMNQADAYKPWTPETEAA
jgi:hypothetical protein